MICSRKTPGASLFPLRRFPIGLGTVLLLLAGAGRVSGQGGASPTELTFSQFAVLAPRESPPQGAPARPGRPQPEVDQRRAAALFHGLLLAQGRQAAARESLDRISGWVKAIQARFEAQNAAALDLEILRFSEAVAATRLARREAEQLRARQRANSFLRRSLDSPLIALPEAPPAKEPTTAESSKEGPGVSVANSTYGSRRLAEIEQLEKELLPQGRDLLAKIYQGYLVGGLSLNSLLWQEQELYAVEMRYQSLLAETAVEPPEKE